MEIRLFRSVQPLQRPGCSKAMIELTDVTKIYRIGKVDVPALRGVNLRVEKGEMMSIVGASGSGKSTLMNIIGCLDNMTSGKYILDDEDISRLNDNQLAEIRNRKLGFVFQDFNLLSRSTALSNVELPMIYGAGKNRHNRAQEALERVGLGKRAKHKPSEMSGGEKQRVAIARALINNPAVILADEPTGNLDSKSSNEIMDIFRGLNKDGITVIIVTHEFDVAEQTLRSIRLLDGRIISDEAMPGKNPNSQGAIV
jgi:putative ABC transport system ATP-binding protein